MEARTQLQESSVSRGIVASLLIVATIGLGAGAGVVAKNISVRTAQTHIVQGQGGPAVDTVRTHGNQMLGESPAASGAGTFQGPDAKERNARLAAAAAKAEAAPVKDARGHRYI